MNSQDVLYVFSEFVFYFFLNFFYFMLCNIGYSLNLNDWKFNLFIRKTSLVLGLSVLFQHTRPFSNAPLFGAPLSYFIANIFSDFRAFIHWCIFPIHRKAFRRETNKKHVCSLIIATRTSAIQQASIYAFMIVLSFSKLFRDFSTVPIWNISENQSYNYIL